MGVTSSSSITASMIRWSVAWSLTGTCPARVRLTSAPRVGVGDTATDVTNQRRCVTSLRGRGACGGYTRRDALRLAAAAGVGAAFSGPLARAAFGESTGTYDD